MFHIKYSANTPRILSLIAVTLVRVFPYASNSWLFGFVEGQSFQLSRKSDKDIGQAMKQTLLAKLHHVQTDYVKLACTFFLSIEWLRN